MHICASYNEPLLKSSKRAYQVDLCVNHLKQLREKLDFYALAITGTSGILGAIVADRMGLDIITVRGREAKAHSVRPAEGLFKTGGYIFFDDLIDSGETLCRVYNSVQEAACSHNLSVENNLQYSIGELVARHEWNTFVSTPHLAGAYLYDSLGRNDDGRVRMCDPYNHSVPSFPLFTRDSFRY